MPVVGQYFGEAGRNVDERIVIHVACFDQRDRRIGVFGEITRNDAAGRARTNNDNVVGFLGHQCLSFSRHLYRSINTRVGVAPSRRLILKLIGPCFWKMTLQRWQGKSPLAIESIDDCYCRLPRGVIREGKFSNLSWKSSRTPVSLLWLYRSMMEAFVRPQNRRSFLEKRFDYLALVPAAAAICYPFLLNAFHAIVGTQAVSPPPLAIASATFILVVAFVVPFLGIALACRPTSNPGSRRLAYASVVSPTLYVFLGVVQTLIKSPIPDEVVWCAIWLAIAIWSQSARDPVAAAVPAVGGWRVVHGVTAAVLSLYVVFHLTNHLFGLIGPDAHAAVMKIGRVVYRSAVGEPLLVAAMLFQIGTGLFLAWRWSAAAHDFQRTYQVASGAYLSAVHSRPHELGLRLRAKLPRHTDRLEFRDRSPDWAHS